MLRRFSLYGLLKNQRYFEPILILALVERGLTFSQIGLLVALREIVKNVLEVPSGAVADKWGRRRSMVASFASNLLALAALSANFGWPLLTMGMALLGVGDAFRTGTHKAMIFAWLSREQRTDERVEVYGRTRSWSQVGSAISIPIAASIVALGGRYEVAFWLTAIPWTLNLVNLATYPAYLDGESNPKASIRVLGRALFDALRDIRESAPLRRVLAESMAFTGAYKTTKDYLQPVLVAAAATLPAAWDPGKRVAICLVVAYVSLYLVGAWSSRGAHRLARRLGGPRVASTAVAGAGIAVLVAMAGTLWVELYMVAIATFVFMAALHNLLRPMLVGRIDEHCPGDRRATILSVESQAGSAATVVMAPLAGLLVDLAAGSPAHGLWAASGLGVIVLLMSVVFGRNPHPGQVSGQDRHAHSTSETASSGKTLR